VSPATVPGFYTVVVTGTSGPISHSAAETDTVVAPTFNPSNAEKIGLVPGEYKTDINVHNPSFATSNLTITKKFVLSVAEQTVVLKTPSRVTQTLLGPDAAVFITCDEIFSVLGLPPGTPAKGFVELITTTPNLNVVAEYSAQSFNAATVPPGVPSGISLDVQTNSIRTIRPIEHGNN